MSKMIVAGLTALFLTASPLAYAQDSSWREEMRLNAADLGKLTDARIAIIKAMLQLTPDQEKYWPPIEDAIRARAKDREANLAAAEARAAEIRSKSVTEALQDRDPIAFMHRRAERLAQRSADLKNLADAWQPLYLNLSPEQKQRMGILTILVLRDVRSSVEDRRLRRHEREGEEDEE
jgi:hypothetical protein